jgi:hypothetical protein
MVLKWKYIFHEENGIFTSVIRLVPYFFSYHKQLENWRKYIFEELFLDQIIQNYDIFQKGNKQDKPYYHPGFPPGELSRPQCRKRKLKQRK